MRPSFTKRARTVLNAYSSGPSDDACWLWHGNKIKCGYGHARVQGKMLLTHRLAWILARGEIPAGMCVCHKCDVRACCNPNHLFLGTQYENMRDMVRKGRSFDRTKTECKRGHPLTDDNVLWNRKSPPNPGMRRQCRLCNNIRNDAGTARRRAARQKKLDVGEIS